MGSWFTTCGVSNLPIFEEDEVVLFILEGRHKSITLAGDGFCESDTLFHPILPLFGVYKDYGKIDIVSKKNKDIVLEYIKDNFRDKKYICTKENIDIENLNIANFLELVKEGHIQNQKYFEEYATTGYMLVHKDVYENLLNGVDKNSYDIKCIEKQYYRILEEIKEYERSLKEYFLGDSREEIKDKLFLKQSLISNFMYLPNLNKIAIKIFSEELNEEVKEEMFKLSYFKVIMSNLRKIWMPQTGCGSQSSYDEMYLILAETIIEKYKKYEEECDC